MPFGKYRWEPIAEIPTSYLEWVIGTCDIERRLRKAIKEELAKRIGRVPEREKSGNGQLVNLKDVVRQWYREMSLRFHPDRDGSHAAMVAVNEGHARLLELCGLTKERK